MAIQTDEKILTTADAAKLIGVEQDTVRKYVQRDLIKPLDQIGTTYVFRESECRRFMRSRRGPGNPELSRKK